MIKNLKLLFIFIFLTGCAQSVAVLGPAVTVATTGSINQALLSGTINKGIKHQTGKNVSEHMVQAFNEPLDCSMTSSNELAEMFFDDYNDFDDDFSDSLSDENISNLPEPEDWEKDDGVPLFNSDRFDSSEEEDDSNSQLEIPALQRFFGKIKGQ